jgi:hypothetical protein
VRIGTLLLGKLKPREWGHLTPEEITSLKGSAGQNKAPRPQTKPRRSIN